MSSPEIRHIHLAETASTNSYARESSLNGGAMLITTDYQTAGRGQRGNRWESAPGVLCELISVALCDVLGAYTTDIRIKWPNDIYHKDKKLCGILIEHDLEGAHLSRTIIGVGLNVNQEQFVSDAPNPISLRQIIGHEVAREALLKAVTSRFMELYQQHRSTSLDRAALHQRYTTLLYRRDLPATFCDAAGPFTATLRDVAPDGHLLLEDQQGTLRSYLFKEVTFII